MLSDALRPSDSSTPVAGLLFDGAPLETPKRESSTPDLDALLGLSLDEFAQAGLVVAVFSELFGETVLLVSDNASLPSLPETRPEETSPEDSYSKDTVCYGASELARIMAGGRGELHRIHALKRTMLRAGTPASIESIREEGH